MTSRSRSNQPNDSRFDGSRANNSRRNRSQPSSNQNNRQTQANPPQGSCWINGAIVAPENASVSVFDHGLLYGDGVFEGMRFYHRQLFRAELHLQRLQCSLRALDLDMPYDERQLLAALQLSIERSGLSHGYIRLLVTRGEGALGLDPRSCGRCNVIILATELELMDPVRCQQGIEVITASIKRITGSGVDGRVKSLNYLHSVLARIEANYAGADEALMLNQSGHVAECSAENIFIVVECRRSSSRNSARNNLRNGMAESGPCHRLLTPPLQDGALEGVTRGIIIALANDLGIECLTQSLTPYDLYNASECFLSGTGAKLIPVKSIDGRAIKTSPGKHYQKLEQAFSRLIETECAGEVA